MNRLYPFILILTHRHIGGSMLWKVNVAISPSALLLTSRVASCRSYDLLALSVLIGKTRGWELDGLWGTLHLVFMHILYLDIHSLKEFQYIGQEWFLLRKSYYPPSTFTPIDYLCLVILLFILDCASFPGAIAKERLLLPCKFIILLSVQNKLCPPVKIHMLKP